MKINLIQDAIHLLVGISKELYIHACDTIEQLGAPIAYVRVRTLQVVAYWPNHLCDVLLQVLACGQVEAQIRNQYIVIFNLTQLFCREHDILFNNALVNSEGIVLVCVRLYIHAKQDIEGCNLVQLQDIVLDINDYIRLEVLEYLRKEISYRLVNQLTKVLQSDDQPHKFGEPEVDLLFKALLAGVLHIHLIHEPILGV